MPIRVAIVGACGQQGQSVLHALAAQRDSSSPAEPLYSISAFTLGVPTARERDLLDRANAAGNVRGVAVDLNDAVQVLRALQGVRFVYGFTVPGVHEAQQGRTLGQACKDAGVELLVFNSAANSALVSGGKWAVPAYDDKANAEEHLKAIGQPYVAVTLGYFLSNALVYDYVRWHPAAAGEPEHVAFQQPLYKATDRVAFIDIDIDLGVAVAAILGQCLQGRTAHVAGRRYAIAYEATIGEWADAIQLAAKLPLRHLTLSEEAMAGTAHKNEQNKAVIALLRYYHEFQEGHFGTALPDPLVVGEGADSLGITFGGIRAWAERMVPAHIAAQRSAA